MGRLTGNQSKTAVFLGFCAIQCASCVPDLEVADCEGVAHSSLRGIRGGARSGINDPLAIVFR